VDDHREPWKASGALGPQKDYVMHTSILLKASIRIISAAFSFEANDPRASGNKIQKERTP
jgi:hypothetical protein